MRYLKEKEQGKKEKRLCHGTAGSLCEERPGHENDKSYWLRVRKLKFRSSDVDLIEEAVEKTLERSKKMTKRLCEFGKR